MKFHAVNILMGILTTISSLIIARRLEIRWGKLIVVGLGVFLAGIITFSPWIINRLHASKIPSDADTLSLLFGDDVPIHENLDGKTVYVIETLSNIEREQFSYAAQVNTQVVYKKRGWNHDPASLIVLTRSGPPDCCDRSLSPVLGGAVLQWIGDGWQVAGYQKWIFPYNSFDLLNDGKLVEIGFEKVGLILPERTQRNGNNQTWDLILTDIDERLTLVAKIMTGANNTAQCSSTAEDKPCWSYASTYEFVRGDHPEYYEILIKTSGTKLKEGLVTPFEETQKLVFSNGAYQFENE